MTQPATVPRAAPFTSSSASITSATLPSPTTNTRPKLALSPDGMTRVGGSGPGISSWTTELAASTKDTPEVLKLESKGLPPTTGRPMRP